jgi:hypothetical protein
MPTEFANVEEDGAVMGDDVGPESARGELASQSDRHSGSADHTNQNKSRAQPALGIASASDESAHMVDPTPIKSPDEWYNGRQQYILSCSVISQAPEPRKQNNSLIKSFFLFFEKVSTKVVIFSYQKMRARPCTSAGGL